MTESISVAAPQKRQVGFLLGLGILFFPLLFGWLLLRKGHSVLARIVGFAWMALCFVSLIGMFSTSKQSYDQYKDRAAKTAQSTAQEGTSAQQKAQAEPIKAYTSAQIAKAYDDNTVAADILYKGKQVQISGKITDVNTDVFGNPYVILAGTNQFMGPHFKFNKNQLSQIANLKKGAALTVVCTGAGDVVKTPMFEDCSFAK